MNSRRFFAGAIVGALLCGCPLGRISHAASNEVRTWTDNQGRKVEAALQGLDGDFVLLQTADGKTHRFQLANLAPADQEVARSTGSTAAPAMALPTDAAVAQAASKIDEIIARSLTQKGIAPNPTSTDEQFVRRAYLDIAGRIPNRDEAAAFLKDTSATKRARLIDQLLDSPGYQSHLYNYFADMFRVRDPDNANLIKAQPYVDWLKEQIRTNGPYDRMVYDMLTATGKLWSNGATGYLLRDSGMVLDNLANTFAVFLGTDVACAQCHDHPFSEWTQKQFYELAAFFGATVTQLSPGDFANGDPGERILQEMRTLAEKSGGDVKKVDEVQGLVGDIIAANRYEVRDIKENRLRLPADYKYKDGKPGEPVKPKFIRWSGEDRYNDAYKQNRNKEEKLRQSFAAWLTHPTNPRFAITIANRMWKRAFGAGVAEPVRNVDDPKSASNPELLQHLGREMLRLKFNLRDFMRVVYNTQSWQRQATTDEVPMGAPYYFQGPLLRRMTAEQTWDSFMTLVLGDPDSARNDGGAYYGRSIDIDIDRTSGQTMISKVSAFQKIQELEEAKMGGSLATAGGGDASKIIAYNGMKLMRASELPQPAPEGHFLREFGQSDRNLIDGSSRYGSQPQVLMLMNGPVQEMLTNKDSRIVRMMAQEDLPKYSVEVAYLSILGRKPTDAERKRALAGYLADGDEVAAGNLVWALVNSLEFMFVQ